MTSPLHTIEDGGVTSAAGFKAGGIHAGFRDDPNRMDMALVEADELCSAAGVFTQNIFCAAPVIVSRENLNGTGAGLARAVVINSGTANAATGSIGLEAARKTCEIAADAIGCAQDDVLLASTGVIGQLLDTTPFTTAIPLLHQTLQEEVTQKEASQGDPENNSEGAAKHESSSASDTTTSSAVVGAHGLDAARAIMTTDTHPKQAAVSYVSEDPDYQGIAFTVGGMAKGSGMIMPNMATMIAVITTDAPLSSELLHTALVEAANQSFNKVTVDSDTSTNDTCYALSSGKAAPGASSFVQGSIAYQEFCTALNQVTQTLARQMAADGEGATKLVTVTVRGAATEEDADKAARTVANSPLVKTAIFGHDANWGRIAGALGRSGASFKQEDVSIDIMGIPVCRNGLTVEFSEEEALRRFELPEIILEADLGAGTAETTVWTCDFSHEYVTINGDYRS